jgi:hypothetical protein
MVEQESRRAGCRLQPEQGLLRGRQPMVRAAVLAERPQAAQQVELTVKQLALVLQLLQGGNRLIARIAHMVTGELDEQALQERT